VSTCACLQGTIVGQYAPANKCVVKAQEYVSEYAADVSRNPQFTGPVPVCSSLAVQPGDTVVVMQVGTVGVVETGDKGVQGRSSVQHAVLVLLTPLDGGALRYEVLTAKQVKNGGTNVAWHHSGRPTIDPRKVLCHCCVPELLATHTKVRCNHLYIKMARHEIRSTGNEMKVNRHEIAHARHELVNWRHEIEYV